MDRATTSREVGAELPKASTLSLTIVHRVRLVAGLDKVCPLVLKGQGVLRQKLLMTMTLIFTKELSREALRLEGAKFRRTNRISPCNCQLTGEGISRPRLHSR
jgi:hypothetical protein